MRAGEPVAVGVVGAGHMGRHHARTYRRLPGARLVGVHDLDLGRAKTLADEVGSQVFETPAELAREVQAASIAVPTRAHLEVAEPLLAQGVDLLVEKPLAASAAEARRLVEAAERAGRVLMVGHTERFNPAVRAAQRLIGRPGFVEVHRLAPFNERGTDVDVVLDLMIHDLDLLLTFVKAPLRSVDAVGIPVLSRQIDIANARLGFESGTVANLTASRVSLERMRKVRLFGPELYVTLDTLSRRARAYRLVKEEPRPRIEQIDLGSAGGQDPLEAEIDAFLASVVARSEPPVSGSQALRAIELAERIRAAIEVRPGP